MIRFEILSKLGKKVRVTEAYWRIISKIKHPLIVEYEEEVKETLKNPDAIRISRSDPNVYLFYKKYERFYICILVKHLNGGGFIITAYPADKIQKGEIIWQKE